jgi:hypothetical protein
VGEKKEQILAVTHDTAIAYRKSEYRRPSTDRRPSSFPN